MKYICPLIVVEDVNRSRFLYEKILRQKVKADYGENVVIEGDIRSTWCQLFKKRRSKF